SLLLEEIVNQSFRFHFSDGKYTNRTQWYNKNNSLFEFINPDPLQFNIYKENKFIGYSFSNTSISDYFIAGTPSLKEITAWFGGDNSWHPIIRLGKPYLYGGMGESYARSLEHGYGTNWETKLITLPLHLRSEYNIYLEFDYEISLQTEPNEPEDQLDKCIVSISKDFGETWIILREFKYIDDDLSGSKKFDISQYSNEDIMVMFTLQTNDNVPIGFDPGHGWLLSNIYIGYDKSTDFIPPEIQIIYPEQDLSINSITMIKAIIFDNIELDESRIYIFLNNNSVDRTKLLFNSNTSILEFNWDTTQYTDGLYEIRVVAYDKTGNKAESFITVIVLNMSWWRSWGFYIVIAISVIAIGIVIYIIVEKKGKEWIGRIKDSRAEKIRLREIDRDQVIKRIESIEPEIEESRPLILYCKFCRSWFESMKFDIICPICNRDQIYAAYNCSNCGKWTWKDEPGENYYCKNKKCEGVRLIRKEKEKIQELLANEGIILREFKRKKEKFSILDK
ncbi:MAG: Ig-like domain-containing protein, partial [Candidatus Thorarchaeota archaeon]